MLKRILSLLLSIVLVISTVPAQAFAVETEAEETVAETTVSATEETVTEPAGTTMPMETEIPETAAPTVAESVPETTEEETVPETTEETVPETTEETVPETTEETVPGTTEETVPETTEETLPEETVEETVAEEAVAGGSCGSALVWDYANGVLTITTKYSNYGGDMNDYSTSSRPGWYSSYRTSIKEIVVERGVFSIGDYAFVGLTNLEKVSLSKDSWNISEIGAYAFQGCTKLKEVSGIEEIHTIGEGAFAQCSMLNGVNLEYVRNVGTGAFKDCTSLTSITLSRSGSSSGTLGESIFSGCTGLKEVTLHVNPTKYMFENCTALAKVTLSTYYSNKEIGAYAFQGCTGLKTIEIPSNITTIGSYAFKNAGLDYIYFLGSAPTINSYAFSGVSAYARYPYGNTTWTSSKCVNYGGSLNWSHDNRCGEGVTWYLNNGVLTISGSGAMKDYSSSAPWYKDRTTITSVVVKSGVTSIGKYAFSGCTAATKVTIPSTVTSIGANAFYNCKALTSVTIPSSVKTIGAYAFSSCSAMTSLTLNSGLTDIGDCAFQSCYKLTSVTLPESVSTIGEYGFSGCSGLTTITIPAGVTSIGSMAFAGCDGLTEIWVNPANKYYSSDDDGIFYDKNKTVLFKAPTCLAGSFTVPETVTKIDRSAFDECVGLTEVTIPESVTAIEQGAFYGCTGLTTVNMGSNVNTIGKQAFSSCSALTSIVIPEGVTDIGEETFKKCTALETVTLPESLTSIGANAFYDCDSLKSVSVPAAVTSIGSKAFSNCDKLTEIRVAEENTKYASDAKGVLFNKAMTTLIQAPGGIEDGYAIPYTVTTIKTYAFENCLKLLAMYIPSNVTSIAGYAFYGCNAGLLLCCEEYAVLSGWASDWNYYGGSSSYTLTVKWGVDALEGAFWVSDAFAEHVEIPEYLSSLPNNAFYGHTKMKSVTIPAGITALPEKTFYGCTSLIKVNFPKRLTTIGQYAFYGCTGFKAFYIPATITTISSTAFSSCDNYMIFYCEAASKPSGWSSGWNGSRQVVWGATEESSSFWTSEEAWKAHVVIPEGITEIPDYAFYNRKDLLSVTIPESVKTIGQRAFYGCTGLTEAPIGNGVESIGTYTFYGCTGLTELTIPASVKTISAYAFYNCDGLKMAYIPATVTTISTKIFSGCDSSLQLYCEPDANPEGWDSYWETAWYKYGSNEYLTRHWGIDKATYEFFASDGVLAANVVIPAGVTLIPENAFSGRTDLLSVTLPETVAEIRGNAFSGCTGLTTVTVPASVTTVGSAAFKGCTGLTEVTFAEGLSVIGNSMFSGCTGLTQVTIPGSVATVGGSAFQGCTGLTDIEIGSGVTSLGKNAFRGCTGLTQVYIPASVTSMPGAVDYVYDSTYTEYVDAVCDSPFFGCNVKLAIYCEAASKPSGWNANWNCYDTYFYKYSSGAVTYSTYLLKNVFWGIPAGELDFWMEEAKNPEVVIPDSITEIPVSAFDGRKDLKSVVIGGSVTKIGETAFRGCTALTSVTIGENVKTIGDYAFSGCTGLKEILIPATVTKVGNGAFNACSSSLVINYGGTMEQWMKVGYSPCKVRCSDGTIYGFGSCGSYAKWTLMNGTLRIYGSGTMNSYGNSDPGWYAYRSEITAIVIEQGVTSIGYYAFRSCTNLQTVEIAASVNTVGNYAFYSCSNMKSVTFMGRAPTFNTSSFYSSKGTVYYSIGDSSWTESVRQNYGGTLTWVAKCLGDHTVVVDAAVPATCTTAGKTEGSHCSACGMVLVAQQTISAFGHDLSGWYDSTEATCTKAGVQLRDCSRCDFSESKIIYALGHIEVVDTGAEATCTTTGLTEGKHCSRCNTVLAAQTVIPALGHVEVIDNAVAATCLTSGLTEGKHCSRCDTVLVAQTVIPALGHAEVTDHAVDATCTANGKTEGKHCSRCDTVLVAQTVIPALGHAEVTDHAVDATCTTAGKTEGKHCSRCNTVLVAQKTIAALGHVEVTDKAVTPTCTTTGLTEGKHCSRCSTVLVAQQVIPVTAHPFGSWTRKLAPTCTEEGSEYRTCSVCGHTESRAINALGHVEIIEQAVEATCTTTGLTEGRYCTRCKTTLAVQTVIPALGHAEVTDKAVAPTCTTAGKTEGKHCSRCNVTLIAQTVVPALGHAEVIDKAVDPTCTATGLTEGKHCSRCNVTLTAQNVRPALGHAEVIDKAVAPTCTATGLTEGKHCSRCNVTLIAQNVRPALGHVEVIDKAVAPTCTTTGLTEGKHCSRCSETLVAQNVVPALGHVEVIDKAVAPTCTATGLTEGKHCSRCNATLIAQNVVPALGHAEVIDKAVAPTCTTTGLTEGKHCSRCKVTLIGQTVIPALGHLEVVDQTVAPTCTATGLTEGKHCARCTVILVAQNVIPALGHVETVNPGVDATCETSGLTEGKFCSRCAEILVAREVIDAFGHEEVIDAAVQPDCVNTGLTEGKHCSRCEKILIAQNVIPALGHSEVIDPGKTPTCLESGLTEGKHCSRCDAVLIAQEEIPASGHDYYYGICRNCDDEISADFKIFASKSLPLKAVNPDTGKAYASKDLIWEMDEIFEPFATLKNGKLTAKKVVERVRMGITLHVLPTGEKIDLLIDIYPTVTQLEVKHGDEVVNGKTLMMDFAGDAMTLKAAAYPADTLSKVTWTVSDKNGQYANYKIRGDALTISNPTGKAGTVTIKATIDAGVKKNVTVKVSFGSFARIVQIDEPEKTTLRSGESITLNGYIFDPVVVTKPGLTWTTSNKTVATVSNGKVTAKNVTNPTLVTITATSKDGQASASVELKIIPKNEGQLVLMQDGAYVTNGTIAMNYGDTRQLSATIIEDGQPVAIDVTWTSSKANVAHVANGLITAIDVGAAKITATAEDGRTAVVNVKISTLVSAMEIFTKDGKNMITEKDERMVILASGKNVTLVADIPTQGANKAVVWEITEGAQYAKISNGKVTANKDLTSVQYITVKAIAKDGSGVSSTIRVKIVPLATGVQIFESGTRVRSNTTYTVDMVTNSRIKLNAKVYPAKANQSVTLTSSNKKVADFVDGELVCYKTGSVTITATAQDGSNMKATFKLNIIKRITSLELAKDLPMDNNGNLFIAGGKSLKLATMVQINPSDATNKKLTWSVAPNDYGIKISTSGVLSTKKVTEPVTVNIMVTTQDGSGQMLSFNVTVYPA